MITTSSRILVCSSKAGFARGPHVRRERYVNGRSKLGFAVGVGVFLVIGFCSSRPSFEPISEKLMVPGAFLCAALGFGRDDSSGFFTYVLTNALLYGVAFAALFLVSIRRRRDG